MSLDFKSTLDDNAFSAGLRRMETGAKRTVGAVGSGFASVGNTLRGALAGGAIIAFSKSVLDFAGNLQDSADAIGLNVEALQGLQGVFAQSGVDAAKFEKGMATLNAALQDAKDDTGKARDAFQKLGITWADISSDTPDKILLKIADALKNAENPQAAFASATDLIGAKQIKMIGAMKQGSEAIEAQASAIKKLSEEEVKSLDKAGDMLTLFANQLKVQGGEALVWWAQLMGIDTNDTVDADIKAGMQARETQLRNHAAALRKTQDGMFGPGIENIAADKAEAQADRLSGKRLGEPADKAEDPRVAKERIEFEKEVLELQKELDKEWEKQRDEQEKIAMNMKDAAKIRRDAVVNDLEGLAKINAMEQDRLALIKEQAAANKLDASEIAKQIAQKDAAIKNEKASQAKDASDEAKAKARESMSMARNMDREEADRLGQMASELSDKQKELRAMTSGDGGTLGSLQTGGLRTGGLGGGGLGGGAHGLIRRGDAARAKAAKKEDSEKHIEESKNLLKEIKELQEKVWGKR